LKLLFDLGHPADYNLFKNVMRHHRKKGDEILIVVRNRERMVDELLKNDGEDYVLLGQNVQGMVRKALYMLLIDAKLLRIANRFKPDLFLSLGSPYSGHVSFLLGKPHLTFIDTESSKIVQLLLAPPFTTTTILPTSFQGELSFQNYVAVDSYKELAHLHPKYFKPDPSVLNEAGIDRNEKFVIMRFSSYDSIHDIGLQGLSQESKERFVLELSKFAKVFISSEVDPGPKLRKFLLSLKSMRLHDLLSFSSLYLGEGATMASESAVLGVPSVFVNPGRHGVHDDLEKQGLLKQFHNPNQQLEEIMRYCENVLMVEEVRNRQTILRTGMLKNKVDITAKFSHEIESYRLD